MFKDSGVNSIFNFGVWIRELNFALKACQHSEAYESMTGLEIHESSRTMHSTGGII